MNLDVIQTKQDEARDRGGPAVRREEKKGKERERESKSASMRSSVYSSLATNEYGWV